MVVLSKIASSAATAFGVRTTAEPRYNEMGKVGPVALRHYPARLAAEVSIGGNAIAARSRGFQILARFIFGNNRQRLKMAMTAPVGQNRNADGKWRVWFFMPDGYTRETLPGPVDPAIEIVSIPESIMAVLRFPGHPSPDLVAQQEAALLSALRETKWRPLGDTHGHVLRPALDPATAPPERGGGGGGKSSSSRIVKAIGHDDGSHYRNHSFVSGAIHIGPYCLVDINSPRPPQYDAAL